MKPKTGSTKKTASKRSTTPAATRRPPTTTIAPPPDHAPRDETMSQHGHEKEPSQQTSVVAPKGSAAGCAAGGELRRRLEGRLRRNYPISPERLSALLEAILELGRTRLKTPEADALVNKILNSADYLALSFSSAAFVRDILGWPEGKADTWLLSLREHRWAEVEDVVVPLPGGQEIESQRADLQQGEIEGSPGANGSATGVPYLQGTDPQECPPVSAALTSANGHHKSPTRRADTLPAPPGQRETVKMDAQTSESREAAALSTTAPVEVRLADLDKKNAIQCRAKLNGNQVKLYKERMKANDKFPPLEVFRVDGLRCITDGLHRLEAALELGWETILCIVRDGTHADAVKAALQANVSHGLPRTNADKRNAVKLALENFPNYSNHQIAALCFVTAPFVGRVRKQLETVSSSEPRMGRDGKMRRLPTKKNNQPPSATPHTGENADDETDTSEAGEQRTGPVPRPAASSADHDEETSPDAVPNTAFIRQDVVEGIVARINKVILLEIDGLSEAEIVCVFDAVKELVSL